MHTFTPSYIRRNFVLHAILTIISAGLWPFVALPYWWLVKRGRRLIIDDDSVQWKTGILSNNVREIALRDVRSVKVNQGLFSRIWGIGDIEISGASGVDDQIVVRGIGSPERVRNLLRQGKRQPV